MVLPHRDFILVQPQQPKTTTESGIFLPDSETGQRRGEVLAVGPGRVTDDFVFIPVGVRPGDVVLFQSHAGIRVDGPKGPLLVRETDILATIVPAPESSSPQ